jgi:hypothetical protein
MKPLLEEAEIHEATDKFREEATALETQLRGMGKEVPPRPERVRNTVTSCKMENVGGTFKEVEGSEREIVETDIYQDMDNLEAHVAKLRVAVSLASQKPISAPVHDAVRHSGDQIASHPPARNPSATTPAVQPSRKMTATEKVLAAKGKKSLAELDHAASVVASKPKPDSATAKLLASKGASSVEELGAKLRSEEWDARAKMRCKPNGSGLAIIIGFLLFLAAFAGVAKAQQPGVYTLIPDFTNTVAAATTNAPVFFNVSEFSEVSLMLRARGHSGTASNLQCYIYRSLDTTLYENSPWKVLQLQFSGTDTNLINTNLDVGGAAALKMVLANTNAVVITNLNARASYKATKTRN